MSFRAAVLFSAVSLFVMLLATSLLHCSPAKAPREQARSVVLTIADGVRQGDLACASIARAKADLALAETCAAIVNEARQHLLLAEDGVDAWGAVAAENLPCAVRSAASALTRLLEAMTRARGRPPPAAEDALRLAPVLAGACRG